MAQFFEKIQAQDKSRSMEFFSNHPNPGHRIERVNEELDKLGGPQRGYATDSQDFEEIKRYVRSLPAARSQRLQSGQTQSGGGTRPEWPSNRFVRFENSLLRMDYPDNWQAYGQGDAAATIAPQGGLVNDSRGNQALAYGVIVNLYAPRSERYNQQLQPRGYGQGYQMSLEEATDQLIQEFQQSNRNMEVVRSYQRINVGGERALSTYLSNDSPIGGRETDWLITMQHPEGLLFFVFTAPERDFRNYEGVFRAMLSSVRVNR